jgi:hypothetical protein
MQKTRDSDGVVATEAGDDGVRCRSERNEIAAVSALVILAVVIRLPALAGDGLWRDQANVYVQLSAPSFGEFFARVIATEWHPPFFFLIMYCWSKLAGTSEIALTIVPFACSIATTAVVYLLGKAVAGRASGTLAAGLYAAAPIAITYSDEYLYPLMMLVFTTLAWLVLRALDRPLRASSLAVIAVAALLVVATHYSALIYTPLLVLWILTRRSDVRRRIAISCALIAGSAPFVFWLPIFLHQRAIGLPYRSAASVAQKAEFFAQTLLTCVPVRPTLAALALLALVLVAALATARARKIDRDAAAFGLMFLAALSMLATQNLLESRYMLGFFGVFCVCLGCVLARYVALLRARDQGVWRTWGAPTAVGLSILLVASNGAGAVARSESPKSGIRSITLRPATDATTLYLLAPDYLASTFAFYARGTTARAAGFVRWNQPEVFRLAGYAADWNRAGAVSQTLRAIERADRRYRFVDVIVDDRAVDAGSVPYGKVKLLIGNLRERYPLVSRTRHPGRYESISEFLFRIARM